MWRERRTALDLLQIVKNKCAAPYKLAEFDILFGSGINGDGCILDAAEAVDVIQKKGSWYSYGETRLGQGREKTLAMLQENPEMLKCASPCCVASHCITSTHSTAPQALGFSVSSHGRLQAHSEKIRILLGNSILGARYSFASDKVLPKPCILDFYG